MGRVGKRRVVPRQSSFKSVAYLMLVPIAAILVFFLWNFLHGSSEPVHVLQSVIGGRAKPEPVTRGPQIVLILDDVGFDHQPLAPAMSIDPNINFAVLPNSRNAHDVATALHARGFEILCHLPMEPEGYPRVSPGGGAVLTTMSDDQIAHAMRVKTAARSVFLDDVQSEPEIRKQLASLTHAAEEHGVAVGIGHMYPPTIRVLAAEAPALRARGVRFVRASAVVN